MKLFRQIALSALVTLGTFATVAYTSSCSKDACKGVTCNNGGTCSGGTCTCPTGYTGTDCSGYAYVGSWKGTDNCTNPTASFTVTMGLDSSSTGATKVLVSNPSGYGSTVQISGTLSTDAKTITFTNQTVGAVTITGAMTLTSNTAFTWTYTTSDTSTVQSCSGNYTKQ